ncbi:hypothetical protein LOAG_03976 [Loa loa]|uniref:MAM domain-containing protein n=1 Tax=Loa loa TaxID=7209 RepID=A0A1S0U3M6_LOALO|nr:hypothetical protein LOAG_03976 [Loa loa]EFO24506.1 hypothetical protein LOAG_03976 [Loa loa]
MPKTFHIRTLEAPWHRLEGNIAMDSEGKGLAKSGFFIVPPEAFFEMDIWMSDNALLTILESMGNKLMTWSRKGSYNGNGWYRLRIPIKTTKQPIQLLLKGAVPPNNFITISNTKLVNNSGDEISCDVSTLNSVKSHFNSTERLTAFQQLHINQMKPTTMILKERDNEFARSFTSNIIERQNFYSGGSFTAPMINSNYTLAFNPKVKEIQKSLLSNGKIDEHLKNQSEFPSGIIEDATKQQQQYKLNTTLPLLPFRHHAGLEQKFVTLVGIRLG